MQRVGRVPRLEATASRSDRLFKTIQASDLAVMPPDWIAQLQKYSTQAKDKQIKGLIQEIPSEYTSLAQGLRDLVDNFHFDKIIQLTSPYL
ncbi:MAG: hypothetical protein AAFY50_16940 [Cyanobacteria bacterium J06648_1]